MHMSNPSETVVCSLYYTILTQAKSVFLNILSNTLVVQEFMYVSRLYRLLNYITYAAVQKRSISQPIVNTCLQLKFIAISCSEVHITTDNI